MATIHSIPLLELPARMKNMPCTEGLSTSNRQTSMNRQEVKNKFKNRPKPFVNHVASHNNKD